MAGQGLDHHQPAERGLVVLAAVLPVPAGRGTGFRPLKGRAVRNASGPSRRLLCWQHGGEASFPDHSAPSCLWRRQQKKLLGVW